MLPVASALEHADEYPSEIVTGMREMGLFGITIPEQYGGLGLDLPTYIGVIEELAAGWMSLSGVLNTHVMAANLIKSNGTEEQRNRWLPSPGVRRVPRLPVAVRARRRQRHERAALQGGTRRR